MNGAPVVLVSPRLEDRQLAARLFAAPRLLTSSVTAALTHLQGTPGSGSALILMAPLPDVPLADVTRAARRVQARVIVIGGGAVPGAVTLPDLHAAARLLRPTAGAEGGPERVQGGGPAGVPPRLTLIGASTGGPKVLSVALRNLKPSGTVVIAQHISGGFGQNFASWLSGVTGSEVRVARHLDPLRAGEILVAPDGQHLWLSGGVLHLQPGRPGLEHLPSIDRLFVSAVPVAPTVTGVLLSGMGDDGAEGLAQLRRAGALTVVQAPATASLPSMPQQALQRERPSYVLTPEELAGLLGRNA